MGSSKPLPDKKAEVMALKPPVVKAVSNQDASFQNRGDKHFRGGTVDICKSKPCK